MKQMYCSDYYYPWRRIHSSTLIVQHQLMYQVQNSTRSIAILHTLDQSPLTMVSSIVNTTHIVRDDTIIPPLSTLTYSSVLELERRVSYPLSFTCIRTL